MRADLGQRLAEGLRGAKLNRLREAARRGEVNRVYVYRLDRLTRSGIRDTFEVVEELRADGCKLVSVSDGFDLEGPAAEVVLAVMAWASKMERLAINERIAAARERVEAEGGRWGRPSQVHAELRGRMLKLRQAGRSVREIAVAVKVPRTTVARHLAALNTGKSTIGSQSGLRRSALEPKPCAAELNLRYGRAPPCGRGHLGAARHSKNEVVTPSSRRSSST